MLAVLIATVKMMKTISAELFFSPLPTAAVIIALMTVVNNPDTAVPTVNLETTS